MFQQVSCIENIVVILYCNNICNAICLDLISAEFAARCTFKRKWTIQGQYRLRVSTYWKCKKIQTK